ncbi:uncharacterized protein A4U43_C08F24650 [Asparagus officinalis]|uniref:uncharacterized protein LOC109822089 n=1 Tax=Asparagus officinalis TaxID=4686 RepID=UPI00098DFD82|nr:uncharacterized protein LOC109822089 [Asparagus officinalis]ONK60971.1 uncharacterized protein A4U43_C08F24650 [Asparagus officinalis]
MAELGSQLSRTTSWIERTGFQGVVLHPRELSVTDSDDKGKWLWHWLMLETQDHENVEVPQLIGDEVYIEGKCDMSKLKTGETCDAVVTVMLKDVIEEGDFVVNLELKLPQEAPKAHEVDLNAMPKNEWLVLVVGDFVAAESGEVRFVMSSKKAKKGLIVKGASVHAVPQMMPSE